jgi:hypothetical protein
MNNPQQDPSQPGRWSPAYENADRDQPAQDMQGQWNQSEQNAPDMQARPASNQPDMQPEESMPDQSSNQDPQGKLSGARQAAAGQLDNVIDQLGSKIPGGSQYTKQAKEAASGILGNLEKEAEKFLGNLGGIFGGNKDKPEP